MFPALPGQPIAVVFVILMFISIAYMSSEAEAEGNAVMGGKNYGVVVKLGDITIKSDSTFVFVGKTERFIFFYDKNESRSIVYPAEGLRRMTIPNSE